MQYMRWEEILIKLREERPDLLQIYVAQEEYQWPFRDQHGRFLARYSKRVVYECEISEWLFSRGLLDVEYPEKAPFVVVLTHDIDSPRMEKTYALTTALGALRRGKFSDAIKRVAGMFTKSLDPFANFRKIIDIESHFDVKSTFFFLVNDKLKELVDELGFIIDKGWEIGLHMSHFSYDDTLKISDEKKVLKSLRHQS